jgi:hypothetical protein
MVKKFKELVLTKDTEFSESIEVETSIRCTKNNRFSLKVAGNIDARDIDAVDINARNINAGNINAGNIDAWDINAVDINAWDINAGNIDARDIDARDINARNINAWDIICESRKKESKTSKTIARVFIQGRSKLERKEQMPEVKKEVD